MPAHKVEIVFITITEPGCCNNPAHALARFDSGQMKVNRVLPGHQPAAVTHVQMKAPVSETKLHVEKEKKIKKQKHFQVKVYTTNKTQEAANTENTINSWANRRAACC